MLDYGSLAAVAAVVREASFERAAAFLGVSPSAVSQRVRALEERVGATLVVRGQPPVPTEAGARLCAHVERVRLLEGELATELPVLAGADPDRPRTLRIAVNADSLRTWFIPTCFIPDDHISPRRSALFMARSVLRDILGGARAC